MKPIARILFSVALTISALLWLCGCSSTPPANLPLPIPPLAHPEIIGPAQPASITLTFTWQNNHVCSNEVTVLVGCTNLLNPVWQQIWEGYAVSNGFAAVTFTNPYGFVRARNQFGL